MRPQAVWRAVIAAVVCISAAPAAAQTEFMVRGFADLAARTFTAAESFKAVVGNDRGVMLGIGVEVVAPERVFISLRASRFRKRGQRVFLFNGAQFDLGIPARITVIPVELSGGYRFDYGWRLVPYAAAGVGWHVYNETSHFAEPNEHVADTFRGYQFLGGAEVHVLRWLGAAAEAQWAAVPNALGTDPNGVSAAFNESDLGGVMLRVKLVIGR
jgi:hypothetical protein